MPVCATSLELVRDRCSSIQKMWDVSFIGVLYPYRVDALEELRRRGVKVAVNPHRNDNATDYRSTKVDQPAWLDYMAALAASRLTINFSQSNAGPVQQLKTRVIEGMLAGTVVVTDDVAADSGSDGDAASRDDKRRRHDLLPGDQCGCDRMYVG